jgi:hypothetical protein
LGNAEVRGGVREMQMLGNGEEIAQLTKFHIFFVSKMWLRDIGLMTALILTLASIRCA